MITGWFATRGRVAELMANDLVKGEHLLSTTSVRFQRSGLSRRRQVLVAEHHGVVTGFALLEVSSLGMNLSELSNAFTVHLVEPDPSYQRWVERFLTMLADPAVFTYSVLFLAEGTVLSA